MSDSSARDFLLYYATPAFGSLPLHAGADEDDFFKSWVAGFNPDESQFVVSGAAESAASKGRNKKSLGL